MVWVFSLYFLMVSVVRGEEGGGGGGVVPHFLKVFPDQPFRYVSHPLQRLKVFIAYVILIFYYICYTYILLHMLYLYFIT